MLYLKSRWIMKKIEKKKNIDYNWIFKIFIMAFTISVVFSLASESLLNGASIIGSVLILLLFIFVGIIFDIVGVAVTTADESVFHSMSAKKVRGADVAVIFKKNANKVASFCNDIVGDICGIVSGSAGVTLAISLSNFFNFNLLVISLLITGIVASLTIGGKATGKSLAIEKATRTLYAFAKILSIFYKPKKELLVLIFFLQI